MRFQKLLFISVLLILFINVVSADRFGNGWGTSNDFGVPPFYEIELEGFNTQASSLGDLMIPVYCDINGDHQQELIITEGNTIFISNMSSSNYETDLVFTINPYSEILDVVCVDDSLNATDTNNKIIVIYENLNGVTAKGLKYDGTELIDTYTYFSDESPIDFGMESFLTCIDYLNEQFCIYLNNGSSTTQTFTRLYKNNTGLGYSTIFINNSGVNYGSNLKEVVTYRLPAGNLETKSHLSYDEYTDHLYINYADNLERYAKIVDLSAATSVYADYSLDKTGSVTFIDAVANDGIQRFGLGTFADTSSGQAYCLPVSYKTGSNNNEITIKCYQGHTLLTSYVLNTLALSSSDSDALSSVGLDINGDGYKDVCAFFNERARCYDVKNDIVLNSYMGSSPRFMAHSGMLGTDGFAYFVGYQQNHDNLTLLKWDRSDLSNFEFIAIPDLSKLNQILLFGDISKDSFVEILGMGESDSTVTFTRTSTTTDKITVFNTTSYEGLYGFYDQDNCDGDVIIKAKECLIGNDCNYINSNLNIYVKEKLCSSCGETELYKCGSYSVTMPTITCSNLSVGTNNIDVDMYTEVNDLTPAFTFQTFEIDVTSGIEGSTCNKASDIVVQGDVDDIVPPVEPVEPVSAINNGIANFFDILLGQNVFLKGILGCLIVLTLIIGSAQIGVSDKFALTLVAIMGIVIATFSGLFPISAMVFLGVILILILLIYLTVVNR